MMALSPEPQPPIVIEDVRNRFRPDNISGLQLWLNSDVGVMTGGAGQFTRANSEYLSIADNASLSVTGSFSVCGWVYLDSHPAANSWMVVVSKFNSTGNQKAYQVGWENTATNPRRFLFQVSSDGAGSINVSWNETTAK